MAPKTSTPSRDIARGTVIITGANGSLGFWFVKNLLEKYPSHHAVLAVRDDSKKDRNTSKLRELVSRMKNANVTIEKVDLASLANVRSFADSIIERVSKGDLPPITSLVCNSFNWSLVGQRNSVDNYDLSFQVTHLSHFLLVLKLLESVDRENGRIVFLGSVAHDGEDLNAFMTIGARIPEDIEELVSPTPDTPGEEQGRGFQRYGSAKLATVMFMHMLNRKLLQVCISRTFISLKVAKLLSDSLIQDPSLMHITAFAMDPGGMPSSRAFKDVPSVFKTTMFVVGHFILPVAQYFTKTLSSPATAGYELTTLAVGPEGEGIRGYFVRLEQKDSWVESRNESKQREVWAACEKWVALEASDTVLK